jgi:hypothetical protein
MRHHEGSSFISAGARALALVAALVVSSATMSARVAAQESSTQLPPESSADSARMAQTPTSVWNAQRIRRVIADGTHVVLTDGTVWEIYLPDRPAVNTWKPGDLLTVREASVMQNEYDYTLRDGRTRKPVSARLVGDVSSRS